MRTYNDLIGKTVRLDRGGQESRTGRVLHVGSDHLVLQTENEGVIYYYTYHLKSISQDTKDNSDLLPEPVDQQPVPVPKYVEADTMLEVMTAMQNRWVQINRGGHEAVQGVLTEVNSDNVTLVSHHEMITLMTNHIRSCSYILTKAKDEKKNDNKNEKQGSENAKKEDSSEKK